MLEHVLRSRFGHEEFKPLQKQACEAILECKDVCLLMATGFGKSLCYQLPAVHSGMPAVVVSPLISLMEDQVMHLNAIGVSACFLNSAQRDSSVWNEAFLGKFSLIYTSPETLDSLWDKLVFMESIYGICCFAVDESHCVSEWGHDFRPAYRRLGTIREKFPQVPIIAATASATNRVLQDIVSLLHLKTPLRLRSSLDRSNLEYLVKNKTSLDKDITVEVLGSGPAIIYCITRESTDKMHSHVCSLGINAVRYHAGLSESERRTAHRKFLFDEVPVIVATIAFGLGVNKSNIQRIIHYGPSKSLEEYYQESGRAGRNGEFARCMLYYCPNDFNILRSLVCHTNRSQEMHKKGIDSMFEYVHGVGCRRRMILAHFEEVYSSSNCQNCDWCLSPTCDQSQVDYTNYARSFARAVYETGERCGLTIPINVLQGHRSQRVVTAEKWFRIKPAPRMSSFGILKKPTEWLTEFAHALVFNKVLSVRMVPVRQASTAVFTYVLNEKGRKLLDDSNYVLDEFKPTEGLRNAVMPLKRKRKNLERSEYAVEAGKQSSFFGSLQPGMETFLWQELLSLRKELASLSGLAPSMILSDSSIFSLVKSRPKSLEQLSRCSSLTEHQIDMYGERVLSCIMNGLLKYRPEDCTLEKESAASNSSRSISRLMQKVLNDLEKHDMSISTVCQIRKLSRKKVESIIMDCLLARCNLDLAKILGIAPESFQNILSSCQVLDLKQNLSTSNLETFIKAKHPECSNWANSFFEMVKCYLLQTVAQ